MNVHRKLSISRAWDETRAILARDGKLFASVAAALIVLPGLVRDLATPAAQPPKLPEPGAWVAVWLIAFLIAVVGQLALTRLALSERITVGEAIGHAARRMPFYFAAQMMWAIPMALVMVLLAQGAEQKSPGAALGFLVVFGLFVFLSIRMVLTPAVATQERVGPVAILRRSWQLTSGNWWRLFGFVVLFLIGAAIFILAVLSVVTLIVKAVVGTPEAFSVGALVISLVTQIVTAGVYVVLMTMLARLYAQAAGAEASVPSSGT